MAVPADLATGRDVQHLETGALVLVDDVDVAEWLVGFGDDHKVVATEGHTPRAPVTVHSGAQVTDGRARHEDRSQRDGAISSRSSAPV